MPCSPILLDALSDEPLGTSELYDRVGYPALARAGLIPYAAFREALVALVVAGQAASDLAPDGTTRWWRRSADGDRTPG